MRTEARFKDLMILVAAMTLSMVSSKSIAQTVLPVGAFRQVALQNGGEVIVRHGNTQRVTLVKGSKEYARATIVDGDRLVIDRAHDCPPGHRLVVEIVTPSLDGLSVADGGTLRTAGQFPTQTDVAVAVESGGTVDLRSMSIDQVTAAVRDGGRILARPQGALVASVARGGSVTYWGSPRVVSAVDHGGVITRGDAADVDKSLEDLGIKNAPVPPVPPVHPLTPSRVRRTI